MRTSHRRFYGRTSLLIVVFFLGISTLQLAALDRIILRDGFELVGTMGKEQERINDGANGFTFSIPKAKGFDTLDDGLRWWIYSKHHKQVAGVQENIKGTEDVKEYTRVVLKKQAAELPGFGKFKAEEFNKDWKRVIRVDTQGGNWQEIHQTIAAVGPRRVIIPSTTHRWYPYYSTREYTPEMLRHLLSTHPEIDEKGKPDATKRIAMARFFYQGEFLDAAKAEIARAKKDIPEAWTKEQTELLDKLQADLARAESKYIVDELSAAIQSGRYEASKRMIALFDSKVATAEIANRFSTERAKVELIQPLFDKTASLLRTQIAELTKLQLDPTLAAIGGAGTILARAQLPEPSRQLLAASEQVLAELHPDNTDRIDIFRKLAEETEKQKKLGGSGGNRTRELLALAISGWVMGPNGADNNPEAALRLWQLRESLLAYQNEEILSNRRAVFNRILKGGPAVNADVLSQLIKYLPPPKPDDLANPGGKPIPGSDRVASGIYRRNTGPIPETASGVDYLVRVPSEYHHGRPYPVLLALSHHSVPPEQLLTLLSYEADRSGYILVAPIWAGAFDAAYEWNGEQHYKAMATLRSLFRNCQVDNNRVFVFGFGEGANFALDLGASHPDRFAGVVAMAPNPQWQGMFMHYWRNYQKLPVFITMGALAGNGVANVRSLYENWMMKGFPALAAIYRGRAMEWFGGDLNLMFDWMRNKKRVTGTGTLRLNQFSVEPWTIMRPNDNRFYWVGTDSIRQAHLSRPGSFVPAEIKADIFQGNEIKISTLGLNSVTIWLDREMIDWSKPVSVRINGDIPRGYKPTVVTQNIELMLEELYQHGDRSMMFLNKLTFTP